MSAYNPSTYVRARAAALANEALRRYRLDYDQAEDFWRLACLAQSQAKTHPAIALLYLQAARTAFELAFTLDIKQALPLRTRLSDRA